MSPLVESRESDDLQPAQAVENHIQPRLFPQRVQFSLASLMFLTALLALGLVLLKTWGHWGLVAITAACFVFTLFTARVTNAPLLRLLNFLGGTRLAAVAQRPAASSVGTLVDLIWGIALPLLCFAYDPGILQQDTLRASYGEAAVATALWQMCLLFAWLMLGPRGPAWNGTMAGGMLVGSILAGLIALPFSLLAIVFTLALGLGLPGFVPAMTTWVFTHNWTLASFLRPDAEPARKRYQTAFVASLILALFVPAFLVWATDSLGYPFHFPRMPKKIVDAPLFD